ncbi:MAG TPA: hypothetical protein VMG98_02905 [Verrucomicrobiae bacterium]|nr:hypothetical protein [Verrucomicrobiae bacterium]
MGEVVDLLVADALSTRRRFVEAGAAAMTETLKRWMDVSDAAGAPSSPFRRWWVFEPGSNASEFVYASEAALYRIGSHGTRACDYLDTWRDIATMLKRFPTVWIDIAGATELSIKHRPLDESERNLKEQYRARLLNELARIYGAQYYGGYSFMANGLMVISTDADEPPDRVRVHIAPRPGLGQQYTAGVAEDLDWTGDDANPAGAATGLSIGAFRSYSVGGRL